MPVIIAVVGLLVAALVWYNRIKQAGHVAGEIKDAANDVRLAARRFGFKRRTNVHPIDALDDARLAAAGIVAATAQMDSLWDKDMSDAMVQQAQSVFDVALDEAEEMVVFARWIAEQGGNPHETVRRMARRLKGLAGRDAKADTVQMIRGVSGRGGRGLSADAEEAIETVERVLRSA